MAGNITDTKEKVKNNFLYLSYFVSLYEMKTNSKMKQKPTLINNISRVGHLLNFQFVFAFFIYIVI